MASGGGGAWKVAYADFVRQPANKNAPTNPLLGGTVGSRGSSLMTATPKGDLTLIYLA